MVVINESELKVYVNVLAVAYSAIDNVRVTFEFTFPIGEAMLSIKKMADDSETVGELSRRVLEKAVAIAES